MNEKLFQHMSTSVIATWRDLSICRLLACTTSISSTTYSATPLPHRARDLRFLFWSLSPTPKKNDDVFFECCSSNVYDVSFRVGSFGRSKEGREKAREVAHTCTERKSLMKPSVNTKMFFLVVIKDSSLNRTSLLFSTGNKSVAPKLSASSVLSMYSIASFAVSLFKT